MKKFFYRVNIMDVTGPDLFAEDPPWPKNFGAESDFDVMVNALARKGTIGI
jgi:hypothetical protein